MSTKFVYSVLSGHGACSSNKGESAAELVLQVLLQCDIYVRAYVLRLSEEGPADPFPAGSVDTTRGNGGIVRNGILCRHSITRQSVSELEGWFTADDGRRAYKSLGCLGSS